MIWWISGGVLVLLLVGLRTLRSHAGGIMKKSLPLMLVILLSPAISQAQVAAAEEAYRKAESKFHIYMETEITSAEPRVLVKQLQKKARLLLELDKAYQEVIKFKEPIFVVSAAYKLGLVYENMAATLRKIPTPAKLTPEQQKIYKQELDAKARPFEEKALASFQAAVKKAKELGAFTDHARQAEDKAMGLENKLRPKQPLKK
jgi:hypothetical protein